MNCLHQYCIENICAVGHMISHSLSLDRVSVNISDNVFEMQNNTYFSCTYENIGWNGTW